MLSYDNKTKNTKSVKVAFLLKGHCSLFADTRDEYIFVNVMGNSIHCYMCSSGV